MAFSLLDHLRKTGYSDAEISQLIGQANSVPAQPKEGATRFIPTLTSILGSIVGTIGGPAGVIGGGAGGAALGKILENKLTGKSTLEGTGKEALLGGAGAGAGELLGLGARAIGLGVKPAASAAAGIAGKTAIDEATQTAARAPNLLERAGMSLNRSVINPKVVASPFGAAAEEDLVKTAQALGLKGSADVQYAQLGPKFDELSTKIEATLKPSKTVVARDALIKDINTNLADSFANVDQKAAETIDRNLTAISKNGKITIQDLFKYKQSLGNTLKRAFTKLDSPNAVLTAKEETALGAWKAISSKIGELEPNVAQATQLQSKIFDLAPGLKAAANSEYKIPLIRANIPNNPALAVKSLLGRGATTVGGRVGAGSTPTASFISQLLGQGAVRGGVNGTNQPTDVSGVDQTGIDNLSPMDVTGDQSLGGLGGGGTQSGLDNGDAFKKILLADIAETGGKNVDKLITIAPYLGLLPPKTKPATQGQKQIQGYALRLQQSNNIFDQLAPEVTGSLTSPFSLSRNVPGRFKSSTLKEQDQAERNFINAILRRESGAAISPSEFKSAALQYFPQPGDSPQVLANKRRNRLLVQNSYFNEAQASGFSNDQLTQLLQSLAGG